MTQVILELQFIPGPDPVYARKVVTGASVIPRVGDRIGIRSGDYGDSRWPKYAITETYALSSLDGIVARAVVKLNGSLDFPTSRTLQNALRKTGWEVLAPAPKLPAGADIDDFDEDNKEWFYQ